jgi:hypothetical protein
MRWLACVVVIGCGSDPAPAPPDWRGDLPPASEIGVRRGLVPARGIVHLHSPYSHDACDGDPRPGGGAVDEDCLADLRAALCATRMDYAALTDHDDTMADESFDTLFSLRTTDERVGAASRMTCPDGHRVLITVGGENELMPIMLDDHVPGDVAMRHAIYNGDTRADADSMRAAGALVWIPHSEQRTVDHIRDIAPTGLEVYQLHANIDPDIRQDYLGLDSAGAIQAVAEFADTADTGPEPDLALISFLSPNTPALDKWDALLGEGVRLVGTGGTDAHQNALPIILRDGERGDSYRRMLRWFSNVVLVGDPGDPAAIEAAIAAGRVFVAFEMFGTPVGFDVVAGAAELGDEVGVGGTIDVTLPAVYQLDPALPAPEIRGRIVRVDATGRHEVAAGPGPTLSAPLDQIGAYRVEVSIVPRHLGPYLGHLGTALVDAEYVWIYASPIYVR